MRGCTFFAVIVAMLVGVTTLPCAAASVPARDVDLIRHGKFAEAQTQARAEIAKIEADPRHKPEALCAALEVGVRVNWFDQYQPLPARLSAVERALQCLEGLPNSADQSEHVAIWKAYSANLALSNGDRKRATTLFDEITPQMKQYRTRVNAVDYAIAAAGLASVAGSAGSDFEAALAWQNEALSAVAGTDATSKMIRARMLASLSYRLGRLGRFTEAETAGKAAIDLSTEMFGKPSLYRAIALGYLGQVQYFAHHLADATVTIDQAIDDDRKLGESQREELASDLGIWALAQNDLGEYDRGRAAFNEAISIERSSKSLSHWSELGAMLANLGMLEAASGHCLAALAPEREALQMSGDHYGKDSSELIGPLTVLGNCELETGQIDLARADYGKALSLSLKTIGEDNPQIAESYQQIALVDQAAHDYTAANEHLRHALARLPADPETLGSQRVVIERNLARNLHTQGHDDEAFTHAVAGEVTRQRLLQHFAGMLDESEALSANESEHDNLDEILALAAANHDVARVERAWQLQIRSRAQITHLVAARLKAARTSADPALRALWEKWKSANAAYAAALASAETGKPEADLASMRDALERAEQALAARANAFTSAAPADITKLREGLPKDSALVGFARTRGDAWGNDYANVQHPQHYFAFRLVGETPVALVDLGDAQEIDAAVRDWTAALRDPERSLADVDKFGADVTRRVWQPLGLTNDLRHIFIVPEGELHRLPWLALPLRDGVLAEKGPVPQLLDSERDLLSAPAGGSPVTRALLVGAVPPDPALVTSNCDNASGELPGAKRELDVLRALWHQSAGSDAAYLVGTNASKAAVRTAMSQNSVIHFATHAFSDDSDCMHAALASRGLRLNNTRKPNSAAVLSGLVLAPDSRAVAAADRDGLLTAGEIAAFNLDGVDTVTLAACDTGRGVVRPDEGVFGLARAFQLAGARNVIMSLWSVDDDATADLMQYMYRERWLEHASAADALAHAARATLAARRAEGKSTHPYYWAAFVVTGNSH